MADPVATVEKIVKIGLKIKDAVDTVRHNEEDCQEIRRRVLRFSAILSQLQQTGMLQDSPALSGALEDLEDSLQRALQLVTACQERTTICRLVAAGDLAKKLRRVKDDILNKVMLASFAINAHTTVILLTIRTTGHSLPQQLEEAREEDSSHDVHSTEDAIVLTGSDDPSDPFVALRNFSISELKTAISAGNIIGRGGFVKVYKCVLNDGNMVAIKTIMDRSEVSWQHLHKQLLLASKLHHKNIVKVLGYCHEVGSGHDHEVGSGHDHEVGSGQDHEVGFSSVIMRLLKHKNDKHKNNHAQEREYIWVEEYVPNGSLNKIIHDSQLDWPSLSRIIVGITQGIHYLHEQHVVHRDVKPSNILLDSDMNPKIADFDLCLVLNADQNELTEYRIAGTMGYISPEYTMHGIVSRMNDVYGFGVTLLETISTMLCISDVPSCHYNGIPARQRVMKACTAWQDGLMEELFHPSFDGYGQFMEMKRCMQVGLLCIQDDRADRPTMADVLDMLLHREKELPTPKIPSYFRSPDHEESDEEEEEERPGSPSAWSGGSLSPR